MFDRIIDIVLSALDLFRFWEVVDEDEGAVRLQLGRVKETLGPGLHWRAPLGIHQIRKMKVVPDTYNLSPQALSTKDGKQVAVSLVVQFQIADVRKALMEVTDLEGVVKDSALGNCAQLVQAHDWETVRSAEFAETLTKAARRPAFRYGVEIMSVKFADVSTTFCHTQMSVG